MMRLVEIIIHTVQVPYARNQKIWCTGRKSEKLWNVRRDYADEVIAFWDGMSHGTRFVIENCKRKNVPIKVYALANK